MRKRFLLSYLKVRGWFVDLPEYSMVNDSFEPVTPGLITADGVAVGADPDQVLALGASVLCDVPDSFPVSADGALDLRKLAVRYRSHERFGSLEWSDSVVEVKAR